MCHGRVLVMLVLVYSLDERSVVCDVCCLFAIIKYKYGESPM